MKLKMFIVRTNKPEKGNKFYNTIDNGGYSKCIKGKPTDSECNVLANCVGYVCGRFNEIIGKMLYASLNCNAENFIERAQKTYGLKISNKPTLGGIMVFQKGETLRGNDGAGHVFIVEKIIDENTIYTSESAYNGNAFYNVTRRNNNGRWGLSSNYKFIGCIINPSVNGEEDIELPKQKLSDEELKQMALDVIKGKYGNGEERKQKLGEYYSSVQKIVNEALKKVTENKGSSEYYTVKKGDSLSSIAKKYKTTWQHLYELNKNTIDENARKHGVQARFGYYNFLYVGEKLKVK